MEMAAVASASSRKVMFAAEAARPRPTFATTDAETASSTRETLPTTVTMATRSLVTDAMPPAKLNLDSSAMEEPPRALTHALRYVVTASIWADYLATMAT